MIVCDVLLQVLLLHGILASRIDDEAGAGFVVQNESVHFQLVKNKIFEFDHRNTA
jgi:hypothetical protein